MPDPIENHGVLGSSPGPTAFEPVTVFDRDLTGTGANNEKRRETEFGLSKVFFELPRAAINVVRETTNQKVTGSRPAERGNVNRRICGVCATKQSSITVVSSP